MTTEQYHEILYAIWFLGVLNLLTSFLFAFILSAGLDIIIAKLKA
jgi:hypothetical protein